MKVVESWLREWVNPDLGTEALAHELTMAGHEMDEIAVDGRGLEGIVIGQVVEVATHPDADRLSVCKVSDGSENLIDVVCGAPNVVAGMKSPLAMPGARLPNGISLEKTKIRGVVSNGMLCSAAELNLGDDADGILELPDDAPTGAELAGYLNLPDAVITLDLTPNRGDCFSVLGIARDIAALTCAKLKDAAAPAVPATIDDIHPVELPLPAGCPSFAGRVIRNIDPAARSPVWMTERLRRAGLRPIHPVVDVTNYVMLELGQPLHAYDLGRLNGPIRPRLAIDGETVQLLDEKHVALDTNTLVISDDSGAIGLAGIMGGFSTAVSDETVDVFFEAAFWPPAFISGRPRLYGLHTDASLRFERGVDPEGQARAVERATALLLEISGGQPGPLVLQSAPEHLPKRETIRLRRTRLAGLLGLQIADDTVAAILRRLGMKTVAVADGWDVTAPSHRFDIGLEVDLIEEVARIDGYDVVPETTAVSQTALEVLTERRVDLDAAAAVLVARDYQEVITYSFVDAAANRIFSGSDSELVLSNPISTEMSVMRSSLWPGIVAALASNAARQQDRIRLFEIGKSFHGRLADHTEVVRIAGALTGTALPEQWGSKPELVDFFDIKADVAALLRLSGGAASIAYVTAEHSALQPGQCANILRDGTVIGVVGKLHPHYAKRYDLRRAVYLFELDAEKALEASVPEAIPVSKFPSIRRDIAVIVAEEILATDLIEAVQSAAPELIDSVRIFDVYKGPGIEAGLKSVALGLILQETSRTLTDVDADAVMSAAVRKLKDKFGAELRD